MAIKYVKIGLMCLDGTVIRIKVKVPEENSAYHLKRAIHNWLSRTENRKRLGKKVVRSSTCERSHWVYDFDNAIWRLYDVDLRRPEIDMVNISKEMLSYTKTNWFFQSLD